MRGFITSPKAARALDFLHRTGPTPFPALAVALNCKPGRLAKVLRRLQRTGCASTVMLRGVEFWLADGASFELGDSQESLAWFAARLEEAGGRYENGKARFPKGQEMPVKAKEDRVEMGEYVFLLSDLRERPLRECFRKKTPTARGFGGA